MQLKFPHFNPRALLSKSAWLISAILLTTALVWTTNATATVMRYADMPRLIEISDVIVHGKIAEQKTFIDKETGKMHTNTTLDITHTFLGDVTQTVRFQQWGGTLDDQTAYIPGDAHFEPGEEVVLFLRYGYEGDNKLYLSALSQAKYQVLRTEGGETLISRDLSKLSFLLPQDAKPVSGQQESVSGEQSFFATLESLIAGIKQIDVPPRGGLQ